MSDRAKRIEAAADAYAQANAERWWAAVNYEDALHFKLALHEAFEAGAALASPPAPAEGEREDEEMLRQWLAGAFCAYRVNGLDVDAAHAKAAWTRKQVESGRQDPVYLWDLDAAAPRPPSSPDPARCGTCANYQPNVVDDGGGWCDVVQDSVDAQYVCSDFAPRAPAPSPDPGERPCRACKGVGHFNDSDIGQCQACNGTGRISAPSPAAAPPPGDGEARFTYCDTCCARLVEPGSIAAHRCEDCRNVYPPPAPQPEKKEGTTPREDSDGR